MQVEECLVSPHHLCGEALETTAQTRPRAPTQPLQSALLYGLSDRRAVLVALTPGAPGRLSGAVGSLPVGWAHRSSCLYM